MDTGKQCRTDIKPKFADEPKNKKSRLCNYYTPDNDLLLTGNSHFLPASRSSIVFGPRSGEMWHYHYCRARRNKFSICMNTSYPDIRLDYTGNTKTHKTVDDRTRAEKKKTVYNVKGWYGIRNGTKRGKCRERVKLCVQITNWWARLAPQPFQFKH